MANIKYATGFPLAASLDFTDNFQAVQGDDDKNATLSMIFDLFAPAMVNYFELTEAATFNIPNPLGDGIVNMRLTMTVALQAYVLPAMNTVDSPAVGTLFFVTNPSTNTHSFTLYDNATNLIANMAVGSFVIIRLRDNSTAAGVFEVVYNSGNLSQYANITFSNVTLLTALTNILTRSRTTSATSEGLVRSTDAFACVYTTAATAVSFLFLDASAQTNDEGMIMQNGAGQVTIVPDTGVTLLSYPTGTTKIAGQNGVCYWRKIATNTYLIKGDLTS